MNRKQSEALGNIVVAWNLRRIDPNEAMYRISKVFPRIWKRKWREYCEEKEKEG